MTFNSVKKLQVFLNWGQTKLSVGTLGFKDRQILFEFDAAFLASNYELSPIRLKKRTGVLIGDAHFAGGLAGVFNDSLPDGWGKLLIDRRLRATGLEPRALTPLDRLALVGANGMGALTYEPSQEENEAKLDAVNLDELAADIREVIEGHADDVVPLLANLNGASQGARPKVVVEVSQDKTHITFGKDGNDFASDGWMIKFVGQDDPVDAAAIEYAYSLMAKEAGLDMMPTHLFPAQKGVGYFGVQRFDRGQGKRVHMITASGLLHADHTLPSLDYKDLLRATMTLTRDVREVEKMYRLAVFNIIGHNRDDHAKNFSFLMDENGKWCTAPAYDLNYAPGPAGEHCTMVMGEGKNPEIKHLMDLAAFIDIPPQNAKAICEQVQNAVSKWPERSQESGVTQKSAALISKNLKV